MVTERRSLGDFASEREADETSPLDGLYFTLDGEEFTFDGELNLLEVSELAGTAVTGEGGLEVAAQMALTSQSLRDAMGGECVNPDHRKDCPGEYRRFTRHVKLHKTPAGRILDIVQVVNEAAQEAVEAQTGRPTGRRSGSLAGPSDRAAQLSQLIASGKGEFYTEDDEDQPQPGMTGDAEALPTVRLAAVELEGDSLEVERAAQAAARREARNAATKVTVRTPAKRGSKGRRTA